MKNTMSLLASMHLGCAYWSLLHLNTHIVNAPMQHRYTRKFPMLVCLSFTSVSTFIFWKINTISAKKVFFLNDHRCIHWSIYYSYFHLGKLIFLLISVYTYLYTMVSVKTFNFLWFVICFCLYVVSPNDSFLKIRTNKYLLWLTAS